MNTKPAASALVSFLFSMAALGSPIPAGPDPAPSLRPKPALMASLGDSITAGTFSIFPIPRSESIEQNVDEWHTSELEPQLIFENKIFLSWASGLWVRSHYVRLREHLKRKGDSGGLAILNVSYPGDETKHLIRQAHEVVDAINGGEYSTLKYVTILIGSNDACLSRGPVPLETMRRNLMETLKILASIRQAEPIRILLVGIPRIPDLGSEYIRKRKTVFGASCATVRDKILRSCNSLILWNTSEEYDAKMLVIEERNRLLRHVVRDANLRYPNLEVVYSNRLYHLEIPPEILAADCFHPAKEGQRRISEETWLDQPWFN
jgi:lysophospholipase L1-like esterase